MALCRDSRLRALIRAVSWFSDAVVLFPAYPRIGELDARLWDLYCSQVMTLREVFTVCQCMLCDTVFNAIDVYGTRLPTDLPCALPLFGHGS